MLDDNEIKELKTKPIWFSCLICGRGFLSDELTEKEIKWEQWRCRECADYYKSYLKKNKSQLIKEIFNRLGQLAKKYGNIQRKSLWR